MDSINKKHDLDEDIDQMENNYDIDLNEEPIDYYDDCDDDCDDSTDLSDNNYTMDTPIPINQKDYSILKESDIRQRQDNDIARISSVLSISKADATLVLRHYNWIVSAVEDAWFSDELKVRNSVGLFEKPIIESPKDGRIRIQCNICFESYKHSDVKSASCGHPFCEACWEGYINTSINEGSSCLILRCPEPSCNAAVGPDMVDSFASSSGGFKDKYNRYLLRSYIEENRYIKWCPAPDCNFAVSFEKGIGENFQVCCLCSNIFCWNCTQESHRPVDCETVAKWNAKNKDDSENTTWILACTKPCPNCKKAIEKNMGCNHMSCKCGHQFCWICLNPWMNHKACNAYMGENNGDDHEQRRKKAKKYIMRYAHYYERWAANESSYKKALLDLRHWEENKIEKLDVLKEKYGIYDIDFIIEAWSQIVECRRILKWTYAYGYYLFEEEAVKKNFFEYLQGQAETGLERLHSYAEKEVKFFYISEAPKHISHQFIGLREKLIDSTNLTKNYFEKMVSSLENKLAEVHETKVKKDDEANDKKKENEENVRNGEGSSSSNSEYWLCDRCTFKNPICLTACQVCSDGV